MKAMTSTCVYQLRNFFKFRYVEFKIKNRQINNFRNLFLFSLILLIQQNIFGINDTLYLSAKTFGAKGDGITDDGPVLRQLCNIANYSNVPVKIIFEPNSVYFIDAYLENLGGLYLNKASRVVFDGNFATLKVHPSNRAFIFKSVKNVAVKNFHIDYSPLPFTQGKILRIDDTNKNLDFIVDDGYDQPVVGDISYYIDDKLSDCIVANGQTKKFYQTHARLSNVTYLGNKTYRVSYRSSFSLSPAKAGDYFVMKIKYAYSPLPRNTTTTNLFEKNEYFFSPSGSITLSQSEDILIENIVSYASPTMTVNASGCSNLRINRLIIKRKAGRIVAGNSDGVHLKCNELSPIIENSFFEGMMDDAIHAKISGDKITEVTASNKVRIVHSDIAWDNTNLKINKSVMVYRPSERKEISTKNCYILNYEPVSYNSGWVTLSENITGIKVDDRIFLHAATPVIIKNCQFETQLQRAILCKQPGIISNCAIRDNGRGIVNAFDNASAIEGPPGQRTEIDNCRFENLTRNAVYVVCPSKNYNQRTQSEYGGQTQLVVKNSFFDISSQAVNVSNSQGICLSNNRYGYLTTAPDLNQYFSITNSDILFNSDNNFSKGWSVYDSDEDGVADVVEPSGDVDKDGIPNISDKDSNNNGIEDGLEWYMGKDPYLKLLETKIESPSIKSATLRVFPVPVNASSNIYLRIEEMSPVKLSLYSHNGMLLNTLLDDVVDRGDYKIQFPTIYIGGSAFILKMQASLLSSTLILE